MSIPHVRYYLPSYRLTFRLRCFNIFFSSGKRMQGLNFFYHIARFSCVINPFNCPYNISLHFSMNPHLRAPSLILVISLPRVI